MPPVRRAPRRRPHPSRPNTPGKHRARAKAEAESGRELSTSRFETFPFPADFLSRDSRFPTPDPRFSVIAEAACDLVQKRDRWLNIDMTAAIGIQIGIGTEIDEKARNSTPIAIAISISTVHYRVSESESAGNTVVS